MREIKFRAWDKKEEKMIFNFQNRAEFSVVTVLGVIGDSQQILMQYTGLKDNNDKEIYEGDMVLFNKGLEGGFVKTIKWDFQALHNLKTQINYYSQDCTAEVIGNIYENPELVKELKQ